MPASDNVCTILFMFVWSYKGPIKAYVIILRIYKYPYTCESK